MKKIRWGVLGTAGIAYKHVIPAMKQAANCELYAIAGRSPDKVNTFKTEFGFEKAYYSLDELLADPQVEAVYIPLSNELHKEWTRRAIAAGKAVLCEKPLAGNAPDVKEMIADAEHANVILMEAFAYLHSPVIRSIKHALDSGVIGTPGFIETTFLTPGYTPDNIRVRRETLGGGVYDLGCYNISLALMLLDEEPIEVKALASFTKEQIDDFAAAYLVFPSGCRVSVVTGMCSPQRSDRFFIHGSKGTIAAPVPFNAAGRLSYDIICGDVTTTTFVDVPNNYTLEVEQMGRCLLAGEDPLVSAEFSIRNARTIDRVLSQMGYRSN